MCKHGPGDHTWVIVFDWFLAILYNQEVFLLVLKEFPEYRLCMSTFDNCMRTYVYIHYTRWLMTASRTDACIHTFYLFIYLMHVMTCTSHVLIMYEFKLTLQTTRCSSHLRRRRGQVVHRPRYPYACICTSRNTRTAGKYAYVSEYTYAYQSTSKR